MLKNTNPTIEKKYTKITNSKNANTKASLGYQTEFITFFSVGYRIKISVKWNVKKKGCIATPITAKTLIIIFYVLILLDRRGRWDLVLFFIKVRKYAPSKI